MQTPTLPPSCVVSHLPAAPQSPSVQQVSKQRPSRQVCRPRQKPTPSPQACPQVVVSMVSAWMHRKDTPSSVSQTWFAAQPVFVTGLHSLPAGVHAPPDGGSVGAPQAAVRGGVDAVSQGVPHPNCAMSAIQIASQMAMQQ
jgi:hypothetical protein